MKVLLDTSFVIACASEGINFVSFVNGLTFDDVLWIVPQEVLRELRGLMRADKNKKKQLKHLGEVIEVIQGLHPLVLDIAGRPADVDSQIVEYVKDKPIVLATCDKGLARRVDNKVLSYTKKKGLFIE